MNNLFKKTNIIIACVAMAVLSVIGLSNTKNFFENTISTFFKEGSIEEKVKNIDNVYIDEFYGKNKYINVYGLFQKFLGRELIGNFEYVSDKYGVINMIL